MDYIAAAQLIVDDIEYTDGPSYKDKLGGAAYALAGMRYWSGSVGICSGVGEDFSSAYGGWLRNSGIDISGLKAFPGMTPHTRCVYSGSEERAEQSFPGCLAIDDMLLHPSDFPDAYKACKGIYLYLDCDTAYLRELHCWNAGDAAVLWELRGADARPENKDKLAACLELADILSINYVEASTLTGEREPERIVRQLHSLGARALFFHMGAKGALVSDRRSCWAVPVYPTHLVDVTGGGNSSSGGFLVGFCESGGDVTRAGRYANASASIVLESVGVPDVIGAGEQAEARRRAAAIAVNKIF